jgi:hypothetical protein
MLSYARAKSIGVQKQDYDVRVISGVLEDELYAMQCEMQVHWPTLTIDAVQTRMKRFTTERCVKAEKVFNKAEGWKLEKNIEARIKKELGREGCRHMAILMVDCCRALVRAELTRELRYAMTTQPDLDKAAFVRKWMSQQPILAEYLRSI